MIRLAFLWLLLALSLTGHEVEQHFIKIQLGDEGLRGRLEMDAGYCLPELRSNEDETLPTLAWLDERTEAEKARILAEGEKYLRHVFVLKLDGKPASPSITFGKWGTDWPVYFDQRPDTFARMVWDVTLDYGDAGGDLELFWNEEEDGPSLALAIESGGKEQPLSTVNQGEERSLATIEPAKMREEESIRPGKDRVTVKEEKLVWLGWLREGFRHVLPLGLDHILFILGLFFLSTKWKPLLQQSLVFTIAHTITLGLTVAGKIPFSAKIIEPLIALSIAYVAIENLFLNEVKPWRLALIFGLGLLHGMGFGSVMAELPLDKSSLIVPVLNFNLGVEVAQVTVIALAFAATCYFHNRGEWKWIRMGASILIAATGLFWTVQRVFF